MNGATTTRAALDGPAAELELVPDVPSPPPSREQLRSRRRRAVRARSISTRQITKRELELGRLLNPEIQGMERPRTRAECEAGPRPCPFVSCKHHLYLDVSERSGTIKLNFPDLDVWELDETCALDVADRGGTTLENVGVIMNLTRERIRQLENGAREKLAITPEIAALGPDDAPRGKVRRLPVLHEHAEKNAGQACAFDVERFAGPELDEAEADAPEPWSAP